MTRSKKTKSSTKDEHCRQRGNPSRQIKTPPFPRPSSIPLRRRPWRAWRERWKLATSKSSERNSSSKRTFRHRRGDLSRSNDSRPRRRFPKKSSFISPTNSTSPGPRSSLSHKKSIRKTSLQRSSWKTLRPETSPGYQSHSQRRIWIIQQSLRRCCRRAFRGNNRHSKKTPFSISSKIWPK